MFRYLVFAFSFIVCALKSDAQDFITTRYSPTVFNNGYAAVDDFDRDGNMDILNITSFTFKEFYMHYHDGTLPLKINAKQILPTGSYSAEFSIVDKDGDGDMDVLTAKDNKLVFLINKSTPGNFLFEIETLPISFVTKAPILLSADFDKDGRLDILVGDFTGKIKLFYNKVNGYVEYDVDFIQPAPVEANLKVLRVADLNNDGLLDIVAGSLFGDKKGLISYINQGESFKPTVILDKITVRDLQLEDFDKDGKIDILTCGNIGNKRSITLWKNDLSGSYKFLQNVLINRDYDIDGINTLDINNDGAFDVVASVEQWSGDTLGGLSVYICKGNQENLSFSEINIPDFPKDFSVQSVLLTDLDKDGDLDFIAYTNQFWVENKFKSSTNTGDYGEHQLLLYPNPVSDFIQLNIDQEVELKVMSLTGEILLRKNIMPGDKTDISQLNIGLYFATITHLNGQVRIIPFLKR
jgi:hypothetical protein